MDDKLKSAFTLSKEEWLVLALGLGVPSVFGFPKSTEPLDRESIIKALSELVNKKFIEPCGDKFKVLSPYRDAILQTGSPKALFIRSRNDRLPDFICYTGEQLLLCEPMHQKDDTFRFEYLSIDELWEHFQACGYLPEEEGVIGNEIDINTAEDTEAQFLDLIYKNESLSAFSPIVFWMELITEGKRENKYLSVIEHPLFRYILTEAEGEKKRMFFDSALMQREFSCFLEGINA